MYLISKSYISLEFTTSDEFDKNKLLFKLGYIGLAGFLLVRVKYYTAWKLEQSALYFNSILY